MATWDIDTSKAQRAPEMDGASDMRVRPASTLHRPSKKHRCGSEERGEEGKTVLFHISLLLGQRSIVEDGGVGRGSVSR